MKLETKLCSSLVKVMPDCAPDGVAFKKAQALRGEVFSFQLAYCPVDFHRTKIEVEVESQLEKNISWRKAELVPVNYPGCLFDEDYLFTTAGMYPDRLENPSDKPLYSVQGQWRSLWFKIVVPADCSAGTYDIAITLAAMADGKKCRVKKVFKLEVIPLTLPKQTLTFTNWFHADCIATYYNFEMFSEEHWSALEKFFSSAASHGINLLLTPLFTLPLDTAVGGERPTCQLVKVFCRNGEYSFDFSRLDRWISLAQKCGIHQFEMSHLFTQWGAEFTPKIIAEVDGREKRIAGWDVRADSAAYADFMAAFLPELAGYLKKKKLQDHVYFHCSDEPQEEHKKNYCYAAGLLKKYLGSFRIMDALSSVDFYRMGYVEYPVPIESHIETFIAENVPELWTYYCCGPAQIYPNRLIAMPSSRNRILGTLLYYFDVKGFLHWGFNFYYSQFSICPIDPYRCTDADSAFPAGDPFVVYPGPGGVPEDSLRHEVFFEALQDQRALQLLEKFMPRKKILALLNKSVSDGKMSMANYPRGEQAVLGLRKKINTLLKKYADGN